MLYYLLVPLAKDHIVFNVFRYLTFRSFMALISALVISLIVGPWLIRRLRRMQHGTETLREDTPEHHRTSKKGTPTMGGVIILCAILGSTFLWANLANRYVWVAMLAIAGYGLIGMWDDWTKIRAKRGIPSRSEEHTSELQSHLNLVCRLLLEKKKKKPGEIHSRPKQQKMIR